MDNIMGKILALSVSAACALLASPALAESSSAIATKRQAPPAFSSPEEKTWKKKSKAFEVKDFSFGVENPTQIGSATGGAGAGKIKFNKFTVKQPPSVGAKPRFDTPRISSPGGGVGGGGAAVRVR